MLLRFRNMFPLVWSFKKLNTVLILNKNSDLKISSSDKKVATRSLKDSRASALVSAETNNFREVGPRYQG